MLNFSMLDKIVINFDNMLRGNKSTIASPATKVVNAPQLSNLERQQSIEMMRINHSGEICAQALYQGQALMAKNPYQYQALLQAASEESNHLAWCQQRLQELNGRPSLLNPVWYAGSFGIGALAGMAGDRISLGFLAETEYQVTAHIEKHLRHMSINDNKSRAVLEQMRVDELAHATNAVESGASQLPKSIKVLMKYTAKLLTITAAKV